jgi:hypothetical protein
VNASASENYQAGSVAYEALKELCQNEEGTDLDHPLQWEALGDFSENHVDAQQAYQKGLICAERLDLIEYVASIKLAMAESFFEQSNLSEAKRFAEQAELEAVKINKQELVVAISEFLNEINCI